MAMGEAVLAMISGLGGAGIGVLGAVWVQGTKRRDDAIAAALANSRVDQALVLETVATARVALRTWWTNAQRVLADLDAGREVNAKQYQEEVQAELKELTTALYRLAGRSWHPHDARLDPHQLPRADLLTETAHRIIDATHRRALGAVAAEEVAVLATEARETHRVIAAYLVKTTEVLTGGQTPSAVAFGPSGERPE
jgi:hypothetical protein